MRSVFNSSNISRSTRRSKSRSRSRGRSRSKSRSRSRSSGVEVHLRRRHRSTATLAALSALNNAGLLFVSPVPFLFPFPPLTTAWEEAFEVFEFVYFV